MLQMGLSVNDSGCRWVPLWSGLSVNDSECHGCRWVPVWSGLSMNNSVLLGDERC